MDPELKKVAGQYGQEVVAGWAGLHSRCPDAAMLVIVGSYATIWGMMAPEERAEFLHAIIQMLIGIGDTRFEDGNDFLAFLRDKKDTENGFV